jgi:hypothetical protein
MARNRHLLVNTQLRNGVEDILWHGRDLQVPGGPLVVRNIVRANLRRAAKLGVDQTIAGIVATLQEAGTPRREASSRNDTWLCGSFPCPDPASLDLSVWSGHNSNARGFPRSPRASSAAGAGTTNGAIPAPATGPRPPRHAAR